MWIARDEQGFLNLYNVKPAKEQCQDPDDLAGGYWCVAGGGFAELDPGLFPGIKWEDAVPAEAAIGLAVPGGDSSFWVARDESGELVFFSRKPEKNLNETNDEWEGRIWIAPAGTFLEIDSGLFPGTRWSDTDPTAVVLFVRQ